MEIDRSSGERDEPGNRDSADRPMETRSAGEASARQRTWPNLDNASDEDLIAFLGLDRADRVRTGDETESAERRKDSHASDEPAREAGGEQREQAAEAPVLTESELQYWREALPPVSSPREKGKPTTAAVFGVDGIMGVDASGGRLETGEVDSRVETATAWMREYGWRMSSDRVETHVETKVAVDMIEGRLPNHVTLLINNNICKEPDPVLGADIVSCRKFITESLPADHSLRVYQQDGTMEFFRGRDDA